MKKALLVTVALFVAGPAFAQTFLPNPTNDEARAPRPARARGVTAQQAVDLAMAANATCKANGNKVTTVVIDSDGVPIALVADDGAAAITARIAMGKAMIALKTRLPTTDPKADPAVVAPLGVARPGGEPLMVGADLVGAAAVSGSPSGQADDVCVKAAIAKVLQ